MTNPTATLQTSLGDVEIELFLDQMPITAGNFIELAKSGFYDGLRRLGGVTTLNASTGNLHTGGQRGVYLDVVIGGD